MLHSNYFSKEELNEFKSLIEKKLERSKREQEYLSNQLKELSDNANVGVDMADMSSYLQDWEMLSALLKREQVYIQELEKALLRIQFGSYGKCVVTGQQIDKRRLKAVPTTTKSLEGKLVQVNNNRESERERMKAISLENRLKVHHEEEMVPIKKVVDELSLVSRGNREDDHIGFDESQDLNPADDDLPFMDMDGLLDEDKLDEL